MYFGYQHTGGTAPGGTLVDNCLRLAPEDTCDGERYVGGYSGERCRQLSTNVRPGCMPAFRVTLMERGDGLSILG
jgi:hypothetical protein